MPALSPTPPAPAATTLPDKLAALRAELSDLAFDLDRRGRHDAADLAAGIAARLGELADEQARPPGD